MRTCSGCKEEKEEEYFYVVSGKLSTICKSCQSKRTSACNKKYKEKRKYLTSEKGKLTLYRFYIKNSKRLIEESRARKKPYLDLLNKYKVSCFVCEREVKRLYFIDENNNTIKNKLTEEEMRKYKVICKPCLKMKKENI